MLAEKLKADPSMEGDLIYVPEPNNQWRVLYLDAGRENWFQSTNTYDKTNMPPQNEWREANGLRSSYELPPGVGFFVVRRSATPACITFTGPVGNDGQTTKTLQPGFNLIGLSEGKDLPLKATFAQADPQGGAREETADQLVLQRPDGSWRRLMYVQGWGAPYDGNWFDLGTYQVVPANEILPPGAAYYYQRKGEATTVTY
jgi:hypothetical protein